jgi:hypothetical protein
MITGMIVVLRHRTRARSNHLITKGGLLRKDKQIRRGAARHLRHHQPPTASHGSRTGTERHAKSAPAVHKIVLPPPKSLPGMSPTLAVKGKESGTARVLGSGTSGMYSVAERNACHSTGMRVLTRLE